MADIRTQKLLYHITSIDNLASILEHGLLPRSDIDGFDDVADQDILEGRQALNLEQYVPFHFFAGSPFDGAVHKAKPQTDFVLITVRRTFARARNWVIIPKHPLANEGVEVLEYDQGIERINWDAMNRRDYHDDESKSVCMAECLSPWAVPVECFFKIFVSNERVGQNVQMLLRDKEIDIDVMVNRGMFIR
ncbi:DUF4433 domain-containing protein [Vibrio splendidus]|uniref:DarT ssDNA thymidine ADP-ribosyltransferase family protein n=1 Tax=Vibrio splendidus TaxID=29497 RepID=UPI00148DD64C|nr:DarT ssDNA thymidine ADP-ribosyltransferase family protein [Vibrio splendidus]NOJ03486.1 DUF4433 domain-containing protein [Vibrio splendidus]